MLLGSVSAGISIYAAGYFRAEPSGRLALIAFQYHVFLASMAFVLLADDAYFFMVAWERWRCRRISSLSPTTSRPRYARPAFSTC